MSSFYQAKQDKTGEISPKYSQNFVNSALIYYVFGTRANQC